jgi:hypothetical protein
MIYPVENFRKNWNLTAGYGFGAPTDYGFHEAWDINDNGGGDSDLGKPVYAVSDGVISSVHSHSAGFGNHIHLKVETEEGTRWFHYAHLEKIFCAQDQIVKEGQLLGTVGKSGTVYAHLHFACKKQPTGIDGIAKTKEDLLKWEDPIAFIERHLTKPPVIIQPPVITDQTKLDFGVAIGVLEFQQVRSMLLELDREKEANLRLSEEYMKLQSKYLELLTQPQPEVASTTPIANITDDEYWRDFFPRLRKRVGIG